MVRNGSLSRILFVQTDIGSFDNDVRDARWSGVKRSLEGVDITSGSISPLINTGDISFIGGVISQILQFDFMILYLI